MEESESIPIIATSNGGLRRLDLLYDTLKKGSSRRSDIGISVDNTALAAAVAAKGKVTTCEALDPLASETERTRTNESSERHSSVSEVGWKPIERVEISSLEKHSITGVVMYSIEVQQSRDSGSRRNNNASQGKRYSVWRRYRHFESAFAYLMQSVPHHCVPDFFKQLFPSRKFIMSTSSLLEQRQEELELWLKAVVNYANEGIAPSSMFAAFHAKLRLEIQAFLSPATSSPEKIGGGDQERVAPREESGEGSGYSVPSKMRAKNGIGFINAVDRSEQSIKLQTSLESEDPLIQLLSQTLSENNSKRARANPNPNLKDNCLFVSDERDDLIDDYFKVSANSLLPSTETTTNGSGSQSTDFDIISSIDNNNHNNNNNGDDNGGDDNGGDDNGGDDNGGDDTDTDNVFSEVDSPLLYRTLSLLASLPIIRGLLDNDSDVHGAADDGDRDRYIGM